MLMRPGNDRPYPQNDLSYLAFLVTAYRNLHQVQLAYDIAQTDSRRHEVQGFLDEVPILADLPLAMQIDVLAEVWARHNAKRVYRASLLDGAVLYAACREATDTFGVDPGLVRLYLKGGTRDLDLRLDRWTYHHLQTLYQRWWRTFDPGRVHGPLDLEDYPPRMVEPLEAARELTELSPNLEKNLGGLLNPAEIRHYVALLSAAGDRP